jgi:hypothetical protein
LLKDSDAATILVDTELIQMVALVTIVGDAIYCNHVYHQQNVSDATWVKPDGSVITWPVCHPVCGGRPSLGCELHISLDLTDVSDQSGVGYDVACGLIVQKVPGIWYAAIGLREDCTLVGVGNGPILVVFGALGGSVARKSDVLGLL